MDNGLEDDNATQPTMQQIPGVKGHPQQGDQGIITAGHEHQSHEINRGHGACAVPHHSRNGMLVLTVGYGDDTQNDIHDDDADDEQGMEATGQSTKVDGARQLELLVMAVAEEGRIDDVVLDLGEGVVRREEVPLTVIGEAGQTTQMGVETMGQLPDVDEGRDAPENEDGDASEVIVEYLMEGP